MRIYIYIYIYIYLYVCMCVSVCVCVCVATPKLGHFGCSRKSYSLKFISQQYKLSQNKIFVFEFRLNMND